MLTLEINGKVYSIDCPPHYTLLEVLREKLGLTGTKHGCELGECGMCTVLIDGKPFLSCLVLPHTVQGCSIRTIEGIPPDHPVIQSFSVSGAVQCGYCTPAMVLSAVALLENNPTPTVEEIKQSLASVLCRCTGYEGIIKGVQLASQHGVSPTEPPRADAVEKASGKAMYTDDFLLPGTVFCRLKRSPYAHAWIKKISYEKALALPGVLKVLTGDDLPEKYGILPVTQDETALAREKVRYVGEPVAAVAAVDEHTADEAVKLIEVEYEPLPPLLSVPDAVEKSDVRVHQSEKFSGNAHRVVSLDFGDVEKGFREADEIFEDTFYYAGSTHLPMEQHSVLAFLDEEERLVVYTSQQAPHYVHRILAKVLGLPEEKIRIIVPYVGGGFGGKLEAFSHEICTAKFALMLRKPVKCTLTREEVFYTHRGRHPAWLKVRTGVKKDGTITALHVCSLLDGGAYGSYGAAATYYQGALEPTTYRLPAYRFQAARFYTNKPPCGPKRGHGTPQPRAALEVHLDKVAEKLGISPVQLRLKNVPSPNSVTVNYLKITSCGLKECIQKVLSASRYEEVHGKLPFGKGIGFAVGSYLCGAAFPLYYSDMPHSVVNIRISERKQIEVFSGHTEIGQGSDQMILSVVSRVLGISPYAIKLVRSDSLLAPVDLGSYSSRVTMMVGNAAREAATKLKEFISQTLAPELGVSPHDLIFAENRIYPSQSPEKSIPFEEALKIILKKNGEVTTTGAYTPPKPLGEYKGRGVGPSPSYSFNACCVLLTVDTETGKTRVEKVWLAHDIGKVLHRKSAEGQVVGSVYMALGEVFWEEQAFLPSGVHRCPSMLEYKTPTFLEMPDVEVFFIEEGDPEGPFGAKEVGQGPLLPVIPATLNALYDAIGIRFDEIPVTPEKILFALQRKVKRIGPKFYPHFSFPEPLKIGLPEGF
ncbi:MAG: molybdopterin-dependent oxidoreductase [bacterium JZ-2024 1]